MKQYPFIVDIPADEYHEAARRGEFLSSHLLGDFRACPRLYRKRMSGEIEPTDTAAYQTGRALHTLILEGRAKFDAEYLISSGPTNPKTGEPFGKTTKAYREWLASQKRPIVSSEDFGWMLKLQQSVALHPVANALLERPDERKPRAVDFGEAVLGLDEHGLRGVRREGRLAHALRSVDHEARRNGLSALDDILQQCHCLFPFGLFVCV